MEACDSKIEKGTFYKIREDHPSSPFRIGQILGFKTGPNSTIFVKCRYYDRPRDVEIHWIKKLNAIAEKYIYTNNFHVRNFAPTCTQDQKTNIIHQFKLRELICNKNCSSEIEEGYVHASLIRGQCYIYRFIDFESINDYIQREDTFFYIGSFEDQPKHLCPEGEILSSKSERLAKCAHIENFDPDAKITEDYIQKGVESVIWDGPRCSLTDSDIDMYLSIVRSIGLYGRALDQTKRVNDSSIQSNLAYAFRDSTKYLAYHLLHSSNYNWRNAITSLFIDRSPVVCTDQLELWTEEDILYFYDEIKRVKRFSDICKKNVTWKSVKEMIEFYYMNKVTESYMTTKKERLNKKVSAINQIFIPTNEAPFNGSIAVTKLPSDASFCEGCKNSTSSYWYDGLKSFDAVYKCSICCISFTNKRRFNRHASAHYSHSCDFENCHQKFASVEEIQLHKKFMHQLYNKIPQSSNNPSRIFTFVSSNSWKAYREEFCCYSLHMKALCRKKCCSFDRNMSNYEGRVPQVCSKKQYAHVGDFSQKFRKRSTSKASCNPQNEEPPCKLFGSFLEMVVRKLSNTGN
ncbi:hypothetical protein HZS_2711, partial [Henneguya salminicola]